MFRNLNNASFSVHENSKFNDKFDINTHTKVFLEQISKFKIFKKYLVEETPRGRQNEG